MEVDDVSSATAQEQILYTNSLHMMHAFENMQSIRMSEDLCDISLETDDGTIVFGHKVILASVSSYFRAMFFSSFEESNKDKVIIRELDSTSLKLLVDFIYTGQIMITIENVKVLLSAANLLQLHCVYVACYEFLQTQLHPTSCIGIKAFADLHGCMELLSSSKSYILQHFSEVIEGDEFLSLTTEQLIDLISSDQLNDPFEEKVFESVIRWVNHESDCRKDLFSKLMKHVRLPFVSKEYFQKEVMEEPLLKNSPECKDYIIEALYFHVFKSEQPGIISKNVRFKRRQPVGLPKVILMTGKFVECVEWYDPATNQLHSGPEMISPRDQASIAVLKDRRVFALGGANGSSSLCSVEVLDLSSPSPCWVSTVPMLKKRQSFGVAVIENCIYTVGGFHKSCGLNSAEVLDCSTQERKMISCMFNSRHFLGVGVLNNILYAVGGVNNDGEALNSVEYYHPHTNTWTEVAEMSERRSGAGVGVLNGLMYVVGGKDSTHRACNSVEVYNPSTGIWNSVANLHFCRQDSGVHALDGLLYVVGGHFEGESRDFIEIYNPNKNSWSILFTSSDIGPISGSVVVDKPPYFYT